FSDLAARGAAGAIVPDLPLEESGPWRRAAARAGLRLVLLAAPATSPDRIRRIARGSTGFLYLVSRYGTTGAGPAEESAALAPLVRASHEERPDLPVYIGFGIRDPATARAARAAGADGVVVATAIEERLGEPADPARVGAVLRPIARAIGRSVAPGSSRYIPPDRPGRRGVATGSGGGRPPAARRDAAVAGGVPPGARAVEP
ncbi:MAG: tryptophan synthase subunit alpha, partial [Thermoplasmata archaeon]